MGLSVLSASPSSKGHVHSSLLHGFNLEGFRHLTDVYSLEEAMPLARDNNTKSAETEECLAGVQAAMFLMQQFLPTEGVQFVANKGVPEWNVLSGWVAKPFQRPDIVVRVGGEAVLIVEVHSGNDMDTFYSTVKKTAIGVLTQFQYLRRKFEVDEVIGFAFPKNNIKTAVVKVTVTPKFVRCVCTLKALKLNEISQEVSAAFAKNCQVLQAHPPQAGAVDGFPYRFSQQEIDALAESFNSQPVTPMCPGNQMVQVECKSLEQVGSNSAIVLKSDSNVYKLSEAESAHVLQDLSRIIRLADTWMIGVPFGRIVYTGLTFHVTHKYLPPLSYEKAKPCLLHLLLGVGDALHKLHSFGYAHLDVRLPNVCFVERNGKKYPVLIDFGHTQSICMSSGVPLEFLNRSVMYQLDCKGDIRKLDWWQLGLLAAYILTEPRLDNYHEFQFPEELKQDPFISYAMEGEFIPPGSSTTIRECNTEL